MAKSNEITALEQKVFKDLEREGYTVEEFKTALDQGFDANAFLSEDGCDISILAILVLSDDEANLNFIKALLAYNPDLEQPSKVVGDMELSPLMLAILFGTYDTVSLLLEAGANPDAKSTAENIEETALTFLLDDLKTVSGPGSDADLEEDQFKIITALLDSGAKVSLKNADGKTALNLAQEVGASNLITLFEVALKKEEAQKRLEEQQKQDIFNVKAQRQKENLQKISGHKIPKPRRRIQKRDIT